MSKLLWSLVDEFFGLVDTDEDGKITKDEFRGPLCVVLKEVFGDDVENPNELVEQQESV
jgi:hypothetical protein